MVLADYGHARDAAVREKETLFRGREDLKDCLRAQEIIQEVAKQTQETAHVRITTVVTKCLQAIYGKKYSFNIKFEKKQGKTWAKLLFMKKGHEMSPRLSVEGGGIDVASFALRLITMILSQPRRRRFLVTDEAFKFVNGEEFQERMGEMVLSLCREMKIQMFSVTDDPWLKIGKVKEI